MTIPGFVLGYRLLTVFAFTLIWLFVKKAEHERYSDCVK